MVERKCLECGTWNNDERFCKNCGKALHPEEVQAEDFRKRDREAKELEEARKDKLDRLLDRAKNSDKWIVRAAFYTVYSTWVIIFAVGGFFTYLIAWIVS